MKDDLTVLGTNGTALDPNTEIKGFTVFGATQAAYTGGVAGPGNVVVNGVLAVSSGAYFTGISTFSTGMYVMSAASFTDVANIYITGGADNQVLAKNGAAGPLKWTSTSALGDNLGDHTATSQLKMGNYAIYSSSAITAAYYQINGSTALAVLPGTGSFGVGPGAGRVNAVGGNYNVYVGQDAGYSNTTGDDNVFVGYTAGHNNTTGTDNVFLGEEAGYYNVSGKWNLYLGTRAGIHSTSNDNIFIGSDSGYTNTTGSQNMFIGSSAGTNNNTGREDIFMGYYAGHDNVDGIYNTYVGLNSGYSNVSGQMNSIFGYKAGLGASGNSYSNNSLFGYYAGNALTTGSNNLLLGGLAGDAITSGAGNIVIGYGQDASGPAASNELNIGGVLYGNLSAKTIGISTRNPQAAMDIVSTGTSVNEMAQLWRRGDGVVVGSMSATGVLMATKFVGDGSALTNITAGSVSGSVNASQVSPGTFQAGDYVFQKQVTATGYRAAQGVPYSADSSTNGYSFGADGDTGMFSPIVGGGAANGILAFYANNAEAMRISGGNVGISTITPGYLLTNVANTRPIFGGPQTDQAGLAPAPSAFVWGFDSYSGQSGYAAAIYNNRNCIGAGCGTALLVESYYANANPTNALMTVNNGTGDVFTIRGNGNVGIGTNSPNSAAALDVASTVKGMLPPRMSTVQRDAIVSPVAGLFIYNVTNSQLELYNGTGWTPAGAGLATGAIAAFAAASCPAGWTEYAAARGRFLRGIDNGAGIDPDGTRAPGVTQGDLLRAHSHTITAADVYNPTNAFIINDHSGDQLASSDNISNGVNSELKVSRYVTDSSGGAETRPANVAVIFCQYSGLGGGSAGSGANLVNGDIWVGNASNIAAAVAMSGDATLSNSGVLAIANSAISSAKIADGAIVDVDVNAAAAIAGTKISPNFGAQDILTTGKIGAGTTAPDGTLTVQGSLEERDSGDAFRLYKNLASYNVSSMNSAGTVKISLPASKVWSNTMLRVVIKGYDYSGSGAWEVIVGGYNYNSPGGWVNTSAEIRGSAPFSTVRLAHDGTNNVILLGTLANNLQYPKIRVDEVLAGHNNYTGWGSGWVISQITSEAAITNVVTPAIASYALVNGSNATGTWPINISGTSAGAAPSGAAGGVLTGTYPNPGLATSQSAGVTWSSAQTFSGGANFPGTGIWNASGSVGIGTASPTNGILEVAGNIYFDNVTTGRRDIRGTMADNDFWSVGGNPTASNAGVLELATGDDGQTPGAAEPIVVRQYGPGAPWSGTLVRTGYLLDANGNTSFPGSVTAASFSGPISGTAASATKLNSQGDYAEATPGTTRGPAGLNMFQVYTNGYPIPYGNLLHMAGAGAGQLLIGWSGTDGAHADNYIRSKRDNDAGVWSPWAKILTDVNFNSYAPTLTGVGASGSWPISITGSAGSVSGNTAGINVVDIRDTNPTPDAIVGDRTVSAQFNNQWVGGWRSALTVAGWTDSYSVWQLMGGSDTSSSENWYLRSGVNATWNAWREIIHSGNIGSQSVNYATTAGSITGNNGKTGKESRLYRSDGETSYNYYIRHYWTANTNGWRITASNDVSDEQANIHRVSVDQADNADTVDSLHASAFFQYPGWVVSPGYDANTIEGNRSGFTYSNNAPWTGPMAHFDAGGYGLQLNATYGGGNNLSFRTRNGDTSSWNAWKEIIHSGNIGSQTAANVSSLGGTWWSPNYFGSNKGAASTVGGNSTYGLEAFSNDGGAAGMSFHRGGAYAVNMGLDPDNVFRIGGWSAPANLLQMDMSGNLTMAGIVTAPTFAGALSGNASTSDKVNGYGSSPDNSHPGTGLRPFYSWNIGCANNGSGACYSNGISVGSNPGDQAYGFQIVQNMWDDRLYFRRYNAGWQGWLTLMDSGNIGAQSVNYANTAGGGSGRTQALSTDYPVSSMMRWKNYGVGHVIFDASAGISPDGTAVNNTTAQIDWGATYPTLMGWNGANTYGVRVARAARAETAPLTCYDTAWSASSGCAYEPSAAHPACNAGYTDVGIAAETHSDSGCGVSAMNYQKVKTRCCIIQ